MPRTAQALEEKRRIPRQQRARESCEAIFEATAQILRGQGLAGLSTNRIAERAGVSIGTLYQYFPDKQAILLALGRREIEATRGAVAAALAAARAAGEAPGPRVIHALVAQLAAGRALRRVLAETVFHQHLHAELAAMMEELTRLVAAQGPALAAVAPARLFVMTRAVQGVLRAAALEAEPPPPAQLEAELLAMLRAALVAPAIRS